MKIKVGRGVQPVAIKKALAAIYAFEDGTLKASKTIHTHLPKIKIGLYTRCVKRNNTWHVLTHEAYNSFIMNK